MKIFSINHSKVEIIINIGGYGCIYIYIYIYMHDIARIIKEDGTLIIN